MTHAFSPLHEVAPRRIFMTDRHRVDHRAAMARLTRSDAIIARDYDHPRRRDYLAALLRAARARHVPLLVAQTYWPTAQGRHWPEGLLARWGRPRRPRAHFIHCASAHGPAGLVRAGRAGMDWALLSPLYPTASHPGQAALGPVRFALMLRNINARWPRLRIYPLGGISPGSARDVRRLPIRFRRTISNGYAGISLFAAKNAAQHNIAQESPP